VECQIGSLINNPHIVVEIPPGPTYCEPRQTLWGLIKEDARQAHQAVGTRHIMRHPVEILVTGYIFLDSFHMRNTGRADFCVQNGGRGLKNPKRAASKVRGIWEIHPVFDVRVAN
jgi:hypothetical protein